MIHNSNQSQKKVRILLTGIGWGGPRFGIALDEQKSNDINYKVSDLDFIIDQKLTVEVKSFTVDYKNFFLFNGFKVYPDGYNSPFCW